MQTLIDMQQAGKLSLIAEFISPLETDLHVLLVGDHMGKSDESKMKRAVEKTRKEWFASPHVSDKYAPATYSTMSTSQLFHGEALPIMKEKPTIVCLDKDLSYSTLMLITGKRDKVDKLDAMLIRGYIIDVEQNKFIFDLSDLDNDIVSYFTKFIDSMENSPYHYFVSGNYMALWFYFKPDQAENSDLNS